MYDVYGLGNALVDMEFKVEDSFLARHGISKGHMTLVDEERIAALVSDLEGLSPERMSGGSAANSMMAVQGFGGRTYYSCKVSDDETGRYFINDMAGAGIHTNPNAAAEEGTSGKCLILVSPDAERTMNPFLGISSHLSHHEIDEAALARAKYFYVEGYLSSSPISLEAAIACRELAEQNGVETAISLSDPSMLEFFRDNLTRMLGNGVTHLFCNEEEALAWAKTDRLDIAFKELNDIAHTTNITLGSRGSVAISPHAHIEVPGYPVKAIDTNGAGDMYAGACLYGWAAGMDEKQAARFGNFAAAELVQSYGARLQNVEAYQKLLKRFS
ncbi:MAG: adenosine kinase [Proteobacteria bacterium]|nr:adenosine kinase [Pseudomonadota bacterium]